MYAISLYPCRKSSQGSTNVHTHRIFSIQPIYYSWVENNSSLSRTHVARSTNPYLARFLNIDL